MRNHPRISSVPVRLAFSWPNSGTVGRGLLLIHLVLSPLVFSRLTAEVFEFNKGLLLLLTALALMALAVSSPSGWLAALKQLGRDPVAWGFLLCSLSAIASTATSVSPLTSLRGAHDSHAGLLAVLAFTVLFAATRQLCPTPADGRWLLTAPVLAAATASVYALLQVFRSDPIAWDDTLRYGDFPRPFATLGHANLLSAFLVMAFPFVVLLAARAVHRKAWWALGLLGLSGVIVCAAILFSLSRAAWLAMAVTIVVFGVGWLVSHRSNLSVEAAKGRRWRFAIPVLLVGCGLAAVLGAAYATPWLGALGERLRGVADLGGRPHIWEASWRIFLDHPVLGCGPDALGVVFPRYRTPDFWHIEWDTNATKAHNEVLHLLATQGLVGLAAGAFLVAALVWAGLRAWRRLGPTDRPLLLAVFASLVGTGVLGLFGFASIPSASLFVTLAALLSAWAFPFEDRESKERDPRSPVWLGGGATLAFLLIVANFYLPEPKPGLVPWGATGAVGLTLFGVSASLLTVSGSAVTVSGESRLRRGPTNLLTWVTVVRIVPWVVVLGLVLAWGWPFWQASFLCRQGLSRPEGDSQGLPLLERAVQTDPYWDHYQVELASASHRVFEELRSPESRRAALLRAKAAMEAAIRLVPAQTSYHTDLGRVLADLVREDDSSPTAAFAELEQGLNGDSANPYLYSDCGKLAAEVGDTARARRYIEAGLARYPDFAPLLVLAGWVELQEGRVESGLRTVEKGIQGDWHGDHKGRQEVVTFFARLREEVSGGRPHP